MPERIAELIRTRCGDLLDATPDALIVADKGGVMLFANARAGNLFGYKVTDLVGKPIEILIPEQYRSMHVAQHANLVTGDACRPMSGRTDLSGLRADGTEFPVDVSLSTVKVHDERMVVAAVRDITLRHHFEEQLQKVSEQMQHERASLQAVLHSLDEGIAIFSLDGRMVDANPATLEMHGYESLEHAALHINHLENDFEVRKLDGSYLPFEQWPLLMAMRGQEVRSIELVVVNKRTGKKWYACYSATNVRDGEGKPLRVVCTTRDVTDQKESEEKIRLAGLHDPLTGLPNRALLTDYSRHIFAHTRRTRSHSAVLFLDLDKFKPINDNFGHDVGDAVLKEVARRISAAIRQGDVCFRLGGDEFLVVLSDIKHSNFSGEVAQHLIDSLSRSYHVADRALPLSCSIGISVFPQDSDDIDKLIQYADLAMYHAKRSGRGGFQYYSHLVDKDCALQARLEQEMESAILNQTFRLVYQPIINIQTQTVAHVEALLRWPGHNLGPERFIPLAETSGRIRQLGDWVITEACRQHCEWITHGMPSIPIAVNVSVKQFRNPEFSQIFPRALAACKTETDAIQVEVTESALIEDMDRAILQLQQMRRLGIRVALDDFGTGFSSLSYLSRLPIDEIKVDKSFIHRIESDNISRTITDAIISLGQTLKLDVVAEGIESQSTLEYLQTRGCHLAQGYLLCEPMPGPEFEFWYRRYAATPLAPNHAIT